MVLREPKQFALPLKGKLTGKAFREPGPSSPVVGSRENAPEDARTAHSGRFLLSGVPGCRARRISVHLDPWKQARAPVFVARRVEVGDVPARCAR